MVNNVLTIHMYLKMLDGYQKRVENQTMFKLGFKLNTFTYYLRSYPIWNPFTNSHCTQNQPLETLSLFFQIDALLGY
jgi:hypothetical protein